MVGSYFTQVSKISKMGEIMKGCMLKVSEAFQQLLFYQVLRVLKPKWLVVS